MERGAGSIELGAGSREPVIILHSSSRSVSKSYFALLSISPRLSKTITMLAFSNVDRRAMFRNNAASPL